MTEDAETRRQAMLATNRAQRDYYDRTDGGRIDPANGRGTNVWRAIRLRALKAVSPAQRDRVYQVHRRWMGDLSRQKVLDLGCGKGSPLSGHLAAHARAYHALDLAPQQIALLRERIGEAPNRVFTVGDILSDDYAEKGFDLIYAHSVLHHFQHVEVVLARMEAKLAPGGRVITYDPMEIWPPIRLARALYRPFQTDRAWEFPFRASTLRQISARYAVKERLGVFGAGKWALVLGILWPAMAARHGDRLFALDFDRPQSEARFRNSLHVSLLLRPRDEATPPT